MNNPVDATRIGCAAIVALCLLVAGCAGSESSARVHGSVYMGAGYYGIAKLALGTK